MKFLAKEKMDNVSISDMLHTALTGVEPARPIGSIHASSLTNKREFCPREVALCKKLGRKPYPSSWEAPMQITFHEGKDKQARLNNHWLRPNMVGDWSCLACDNVMKWVRNPLACNKCGSKRLEYKEVQFHHPSEAHGSLDAIVYVGKPLLRLVEFKIMSTTEWEKLVMPLSEHSARSKLYMELIRDSNHPHKDEIDTERMHVVYCLRGYGKTDPEKKRISPFKEFIVHADKAQADYYLNMAEAVKVSRESDWEMIPEGVCSTMFEKRCASCSVVKECFSGKYPAQIGWKPE